MDWDLLATQGIIAALISGAMGLGIRWLDLWAARRKESASEGVEMTRIRTQDEQEFFRSIMEQLKLCQAMHKEKDTLIREQQENIIRLMKRVGDLEYAQRTFQRSASKVAHDAAVVFDDAINAAETFNEAVGKDTQT